MDDLRLYNTALSEAQIQELYNLGGAYQNKTSSHIDEPMMLVDGRSMDN
jgi:type IV pilus biogenesis protein CpaD/CtpE